MNWILLIIAGLFEVGLAACVGKARPASGSSAICLYTSFAVCLTISMLLLMKATQELPIGAVTIGIISCKEPADFWHLFFITTLIASIVRLKAVSH
ncbi:MAG: DMT family transporter [Bacteroidota bacterium]